jgi:hypothetical protein
MLIGFLVEIFDLQSAIQERLFDELLDRNVQKGAKIILCADCKSFDT